MTGFGEAQQTENGLTILAEIRTINSRYLKITCRITEGFAALESRVEALVRSHLRRGTVQLNLILSQESSQEVLRIHVPVLLGYYERLTKIQQQLGLKQELPIAALLDLPGVIDSPLVDPTLADRAWPLLRHTVCQALAKLDQMRAHEGQIMADDMRQNCQWIGQLLDQIQLRAPLVVKTYHQRLTERLNALLAEFQASFQPADLVREAGIFADRADISEEIVRLRSHLKQFHAALDAPESQGRKLDFLIQEMQREASTMGGKANDAEISAHVVEIKTAIEKLREMVQNVE